MVCNHPECDRPVISAEEKTEDSPCVEFKSFARYAEQDNAARRGQTRPECQLAKILVECQENSLFSYGTLQNGLVVGALHRFSRRQDIMSSVTKSPDYGRANVFIGEQPHGVLLSGRDWIDLLIGQKLVGIGKTCLDVFPRDVIVFVEYIVNAPPLREQSDDEFHSQTGAPDDRLANKHGGINRNAIVHGAGIVTKTWAIAFRGVQSEDAIFANTTKILVDLSSS